ncbi:hypothetical protein D3C78_675480 [compost metagenome]
MGDTVYQLFLAGDQRIDVIRHLVKGHPKPVQTGGRIEMGTFIQVPGTQALCRIFQLQQILPVRAHPQKHRQRQRHADKHQQRQIQQPHLMQIEQIRDRAHHQHIVAAGNALHKGVLIVERDNFAKAQAFLQVFTQILFTQRFNVQLKRQVQIQRGDGLVPVFQRNFP